MTNPTDMVREIEKLYNLGCRTLSSGESIRVHRALRDIALRTHQKYREMCGYWNNATAAQAKLEQENARLKAELQGLVDDGTIVRDDNA